MTAEANFLTILFDKLNGSGLAYAVMRNHETLPCSAGGSDLDLLVRPQDKARIKTLVAAAIESAGGISLGISETAGLVYIFALGRNPAPHRNWWGLRIDVNVGLFYRGQALLTSGFSWPVRVHRGILVLDDGLAGVLGVLKEVLHNGVVPVRYLAAARRGVEADWSVISSLLAPLGPVALEGLRKLVLSEVGLNQAAECRRVTNSFLRYTLAEHPVEYLKGVAVSESSKLRRYVKPSGLVVAFLGVDGAGKTTIIDSVKPVLDDATHNAAVVWHLRPAVLPPLARLKGTGSLPTGPVVDPHSSVPSGFLGSLLRLTYLTLDYQLGYWLKTRPRIAKQPTVVIFDRYAYDMALDPRRFKINLPPRLTRCFTRMAPRPDIVFCLHGDPQVLAARKKELPLDEVYRQVAAIKSFASAENRAILVSTEGSVEETKDLVVQAICEYCRNKQGMLGG